MTCKSMRCNTDRVNALRRRDRVPSTAGSAVALVTPSSTVCEATLQQNATQGGARERHRHPPRRDRCAGVCDTGAARSRPAARLDRLNRQALPITISLDTQPRTRRGRPPPRCDNIATYARAAPLPRGLLHPRGTVNDTVRVKRSQSLTSASRSRRRPPADRPNTARQPPPGSQLAIGSTPFRPRR